MVDVVVPNVGLANDIDTTTETASANGRWPSVSSAGASKGSAKRTQSGPCLRSTTEGDTHRAQRPSYSNRWQCELCGRAAPPVVGSFGAFMGTGSRHHCRICGRTVCDACSNIPPRGVRSCKVCIEENDMTKCEEPREKYVFLVRHAQSTWNQNVDMVKTFRTFALEDISLKDVVSRAAHLVSSEVWNTDHPISEQGVRQTEELRHKISAMRQFAAASYLDDQCGGYSPASESSPSSSSSSTATCTRRYLLQSERERRYYDRFLTRRQQIYCSPLLRALQTAHLALPEHDGWGSIKLLKEARERFRLRIERDCVGARVGRHIIDRAMRMGHELPGIENRVDATDCDEKWWSDEPESEADVEARLKTLWRLLLEEDRNDSCVLVTHSNLIKALLMHFGSVDGAEDVQARCDLNEECQVHEDVFARSTDRGSTTTSRSGFGVWKALRGLSSGTSVAKEIPEDFLKDVGNPEPDPFVGSEPEECEISSSPWQVVARSSEDLRKLKIDRLQNCGVLGLRCVLESPVQRPFPEVDGWIDLNEYCVAGATEPFVAEPRWVARDALLMFDSVLVK